MRIPLSWLREYAQVPADATAEDVMADLVKVGLEEEDVHRPLDELKGPIVVGQVLSVVKEPQSNGKTINWCQVRVVPEGRPQTLAGDGIDPSGVQGIVCGAHNFEPGDKVVVTLPGAVLPGASALAMPRPAAKPEELAPGIKLSLQVPTDPGDDDLRFAQQLGVEYVNIPSGGDRSTLESFTRWKARVEAAGLKVWNIGNSNVHNMPEVTLAPVPRRVASSMMIA